MPFTLAHPAAILPLTRRAHRGNLAFSALVLGSMAPDFPYFLHFQGDAHSFGHTLPGLFLFDLPGGLLALWLVHGLLKFPLLTLFPVSHQERLIPIARGFRFWPWPRLQEVLLSLFVGSLTHLAWDAFTHDSGWPVRQFPTVFQAMAELPRFGPVPLYDLLQYGSGAVGCVVLVVGYYQWFRGAPRLPVRAELVWPEQTRCSLLLAMGCVALLLGSVFGYWQVQQLRAVSIVGDWPKLMVRFTLIGCISTLVVELMIYSELWRRFVMERHLRERRTVMTGSEAPVGVQETAGSEELDQRN